MSSDRDTIAVDDGPCAGCGLCCDGTLYSFARAEDDEKEGLAAIGLSLTEHEGKSYFRLPCTKVSCGRCTIYEDRFTICRSFSCALLKRYEAGEIGPIEARETVADPTRLVAAVTADDPAAASHESRKRIRNALAEECASGSEARRRTLAARLLRIVALDEFLERRFRNRKDEAAADAGA